MMRRSFSSVAVRFSGLGEPARVLKLEPSSVGEPSANQVAVKFEASAIHPADIAVVKGLTTGATGSNVGGSEGAGVVESVGSNVSGFKKGDHVLVSGLGVGTWATKGVFEENHVFQLAKKTAWESAASLGSVCAAYVLLADYAAGLKSGDVLINVGAPGAVSMSLTQLASAKGIKVINIIENGPGSDEAVALLKEHGAFAAVTTDYARSAAFRRLLSDLPAPSLALNGLGGRGATEAIRTLGAGGTLVTYGGKPFDVPSSHLIDGGITLKGFSLERKMQSLDKAAAQQIVSEAEKLSPKVLLETHALSKFDAALARHQEPFRNRKVVLLNKN